MRLRSTTIWILLAAFCLSAGGAGSAGESEAHRAPETTWPTTSWPISSAEEQGMDSAGLARLVETVGTYKQDNLTIIRHGKIVADAYYAPYAAGISHDLRSVTKSIVSTLTAIELKQGLLDSVDHPVLDLFADKHITDIDDNKKAMTVQHLLDMTSGFEWQEKNYSPDETIMRMYKAPDRTEFVLNQPMSSAPGTKFYYNSGNPYVLSALITKKTGSNAFDFATKELFGPLGITSAKWGKVDAQGVTDGEAGLSLAPHDMARIGYLYLHDGMWDGKQIIPSSWVERAKAGIVPATGGTHYSNLWWSFPEKGAYMALGRHSQMILVMPKLDVVAVMTGIVRDDARRPIRQVIDGIAALIKADAALPPDPVAQALLATVIQRAATETPADVGSTPDLAKDVSGVAYQFADNRLNVTSFTLNLFGPDPSWKITTEKDHFPQTFSGLIGLNGLFRKSPPAFYGINATKGRWLGQHSFQIERRILGHSETQMWVLTFDGDKVDVSYEDTDGFKTQLHGEKSLTAR
jgi:CubicO group peptidase (beta-lactamase class C family)